MSAGTIPNAPGRLESILGSGQFAVAVEMTPPVGPNPAVLQRQIEALRGHADAYNVTDNQSARVHASSLAGAIVLRQAGLEPVLQMTCRDRNRLALQADLIGASMFGIRNVVALSGDDPSAGDHPQARFVADLDSINLVRMIRAMTDRGVFENGAEIPRGGPDLFVGAVANPFAPPHDYRPQRLAKKVAAGAQFIQTQLIFNLDRFRDYMVRVVDMGLHEQTAILAGIGAIRSERVARYLRDKVAGIDVPDAVLSRFEGLSKEDQEKAGLELCCEIGDAVRSIEGVRGVHIMAMNWTDAVCRVTETLGLYPRPEPGAETQAETARAGDSLS